MREHDERDLRTRLLDEAERHQPDRDAMLERIIAARARKSRPALLRLRPLAAAAGVAAVLGVSIAGVRIAGSDDDHVAAPAASGAPVSPDASTKPTGPGNAASPGSSALPGSSAAPGSAAAPGSSGAPGHPSASKGGASVNTPGGPSSGSSAGPSSPSSPTNRANPPTRSTDGYLSGDATLNPNPNPNWSENDVVLTTTKTLTALDVTITIAKTGQAENTGKFTTIPPEMMTCTVTEHAATIVYRFVLKDGHTLAPGDYTFAAQYNHTAKRSIKADKYTATTSAGKTVAEIAGWFRT